MSPARRNLPHELQTGQICPSMAQHSRGPQRCARFTRASPVPLAVRGSSIQRGAEGLLGRRVAVFFLASEQITNENAADGIQLVKYAIRIAGHESVGGGGCTRDALRGSWRSRYPSRSCKSRCVQCCRWSPNAGRHRAGAARGGQRRRVRGGGTWTNAGRSATQTGQE